MKAKKEQRPQAQAWGPFSFFRFLFTSGDEEIKKVLFAVDFYEI